MNELPAVIGLAFLPALGNFSGGLLAEVRPPSGARLNRALHAAAGIVLAIVAVELMPRSLQAASGWLVGALFGLGGGAYLGFQWLVRKMQADGAGDAGQVRMWMIYIAVVADLVSDGLMIGVGASLSSNLALLLAVGQLLADVPEGYAVMSNMRNRQVPRRRRILFSASFALPVLSTAVVAYLVLRNQTDAVQVSGLAFVAGLLTVAAVEDMLEEAHESAVDARGSVMFMVLGFVLFVFISAGLGE